MNINGITSLANTQQVTGVASGTQPNAKGFSDFLSQAISNAEQTQAENNLMSDMVLSGDVDDLHSVTLATAKADLALNLVIQVKNKALDAYNEIMRMQV